MEFVVDLRAVFHVACRGGGFGRIDVRLKCREIFRGASRAGQARDLGADQDPRLGQVLRADRAHVIQVGQPGHRSTAAAFLDEGTAGGTLPEFEQPGDLKGTQGFAQRIAADLELLGKLPLGGQAVADAQRLFRELRADLLGNLLERALARDRAKAVARTFLPGGARLGHLSACRACGARSRFAGSGWCPRRSD
jgi:hypothetical protein